MTTVVTQQNSFVSIPVSVKRKKTPRSKVGSVAKVQLGHPKQTSKDPQSIPKISCKESLSRAMQGLDPKHNEIILPLLNKASSLGCILSSTSLAFSLIYAIKMDLAEVRVAHEEFFSKNPAFGKKFEIAVLTLAYNGKALDRVLRNNRLITETLIGLKAAIDSLYDIKEGIVAATMSTTKVNKDRLSAIKTKSLCSAIQSIEFVVALVQSDGGKNILSASLLDSVEIPSQKMETLLQDIPQIIDHLLVQVLNDLIAEEVFAEIKETSINTAEKRAIIHKLLAELRNGESYDLNKIQKFQKLFPELGAYQDQDSDFQNSVRLSAYTCQKIAQICLNWETLYAYMNFPQLKDHYRSLYASLDQCEKSIKNLREREIVKFFASIPSFKAFHDEIEVCLERFFEKQPENALSILKRELEGIKTSPNLLTFLTITNANEDLQKAFYGVWDTFISKEDAALELIMLACLTLDTKKYDTKEIEEKIIALTYWFLSESYLPFSVLAKWRSKSCEPTSRLSESSNKNKKKRGKKKPKIKGKENRGTINEGVPPVDKSSTEAAATEPNETVIVPPEEKPPAKAAVIVCNTVVSNQEKPVEAPTESKKSSSPTSPPKKAKKKKKSASQQLQTEMSSESQRKFRNIKKLVEQFGWVFDHATGSHYIYKHPKIAGSLSIPKHEVVALGTAIAIIKQLVLLDRKSSE